MEPLDFTRSSALNNIPAKKLKDRLDTIADSADASDVKNLKTTAYIRYHESNIPLEYWDLKMDKDFIGDSRLKLKYEDYISDLKKSYQTAASFCLAGGHGVGKQLSLETELPTPSGFIKLADLKKGDKLFDENGEICSVTMLHPINLSPESYLVIFDDGTKVEACADHQWLTYTRSNRVYGSPPTVKTTKEILDTLKFKNGKSPGSNHSIPCCKPINYPVQDLLIDPYVLGCWLGDGTTRDGSIECADDEILDNIVKSGYSVHLSEGSVGDSKSCRYRIGDLVKNELTKQKSWIGLLRYQLKQLNLEGDKHIPDEYLYSSYDQRLALLQGLMDTDGCCLKGGLSEICTKYSSLAQQITELVRSLGIKCNVKKNEAWLYDKRCADRYRITFTTQLPVFKMKRKLGNIRLDKQQLNRTKHRYIVDVQRIESKPMRCITVDSPSHLFLITRSFIATHNTMTMTCILKKACQKGYSCLYTTLSDIVSVMTSAPGEDRFLARQELTKVDFLVIDEFDPRFMASDNAADLYARTLESVFRTRGQNKLPTLMCTNSPNVIESFNGPLKASIASLMKGYVKIFPVLGEDVRGRK
jgi:Homing endonuclease